MAAERDHPSRPETSSSAGILSLVKLLICYSALDQKLKSKGLRVLPGAFRRKSCTSGFFLSNTPRSTKQHLLLGVFRIKQFTSGFFALLGDFLKNRVCTSGCLL